MTAPLLVRLPNHLGDTLMTLPALERLAAAGRALVLIGKPWARPLLAAYPWPHHVAAATFGATVGQWRQLSAQHGTALAARLGGVQAAGYATEARRWLLARSLRVPARWRGDLHTVEYYDALAGALTGEPPRNVPPLDLRLEPRATRAAQDLLARAGVGPPYVVLCPGATGRHRGREKTWHGYPRLTAWLIARGERVVALPGTNERARFETVLPGATILPEADVATFGALLAASRLVVANDSGPGHLAAAVGAQLVSLFGVTEVEKTRPWGRRVTVVGSRAGWPRFEQVTDAVAGALAD